MRYTLMRSVARSIDAQREVTFRRSVRSPAVRCTQASIGYVARGVGCTDRRALATTIVDPIPQLAPTFPYYCC